jgi:putative transposase
VFSAVAGRVRGDLHRSDLRQVRDGQVGNQPFYAAIGVDPGGLRDVLGLERYQATEPPGALGWWRI